MGVPTSVRLSAWGPKGRYILSLNSGLLDDVVRSGAQIGLETYSLLIDVVHALDVACLKSLRGATAGDYARDPLAKMFQESLDLITIAVDRRYILERELLAQVHETVVGSKGATRWSAFGRTQPTASGSTSNGVAIRVTARSGEKRLAVPVTLRNHQTSQEVVTLQATSLQELGSTIILPDRLSFQPAQVTLPGRSAATVYIKVELGPDFQPGNIYYAEIYIVGGSDPRRLPFYLTILPSSSVEEDGPTPAANMSDKA